MAWELTVSDKVGSWGAARKFFRPGIYIITDPAIADAAQKAGKFISVREVEGDTPSLVDTFRPERLDASEGALKRADFTKIGNDYICAEQGCTSPPFATVGALEAHQMSSHGEIIEPPPVEEPSDGDDAESVLEEPI